MSRPIASLRTSVMASLLAATACTGTPGEEQTTLVYLAHAYRPRIDADGLLIDRYHELHPDVRIEQVLLRYPEFPDRVKADLETDVIDVFAEETSLAPFFASGDVAPVDYAAMGFDSAEELERKYIPGGLDPFTYDGTLYAVPNEATSHALFINAELFREAGIDPVTEYPRTWEDVLALSERLVERDRLGRLTQRGFDFIYPGSPAGDPPENTVFPMIAQEGGAILSEDAARSAFDSPGTIEAFRFIKDWVFTHRLGDPFAEPAFDAFLGGTVAMIVMGPWYLPILEERAPDVYENVMVVPFPEFSDAVAPYGPQMDGYGLMVNADISPEKQRAAWEFIAFMTHDPVRWVQQTQLLVPRVEVYEHTEEIAAELEFLDVFLDALKRPQLGLYDQPEADAITAAINDAIVRMGTEDQSPEEAVAAADGQIQAILDGS